MLRNLAQFYHKDPMDLLRGEEEKVGVSCACPSPTLQDLTHLGKGTHTLNLYHSDHMLMSPVVAIMVFYYYVVHQSEIRLV